MFIASLPTFTLSSDKRTSACLQIQAVQVVYNGGSLAKTQTNNAYSKRRVSVSQGPCKVWSHAEPLSIASTKWKTEAEKKKNKFAQENAAEHLSEGVASYANC